MKAPPDEYLPDSASAERDPRELAAERRKLIRELGKRAKAAAKAKIIEWRAKSLLDVMLDLAREAGGDHNSFSAGEKLLAAAASMSRNTIRAYRWQLELAGLIKTEKVWSWRDEAFYELKWTLLFKEPSGSIFDHYPGSILNPEPGSKTDRYLIRKRLVGLSKLYPPGGSLLNRAADAGGTGAGKQPGPGASKADPEHAPASGGLRSASGVPGKAASKGALSGAESRNRRCKEALGRMNAALKGGWIDTRKKIRPENGWRDDCGKWGKRCWQDGLSADVLRVANEIMDQRKTGKPFRISPAAAAEDLWKRWKCGGSAPAP